MTMCLCMHAHVQCVCRLPLVQCKKKYPSMDSEYREENLKQLVNGSAHKFHLDKEINFGSFVAQYGYRYKVSKH